MHEGRTKQPTKRRIMQGCTCCDVCLLSGIRVQYLVGCGPMPWASLDRL